MNLNQLFALVKDAIDKFKAGDKWGAGLVVIAILQALYAAMPTVNPPRAKSASNFCCETATEDELVAELESLHSAGPTGPVIDALLPILLALLKKWLGF